MNVLALIVFLSFSYNSSRDISKEPHIVSQKATSDSGRELWVHNPLNKAVWIWIECENVISVEPIGLPGRYISEIHLKSNEPETAINNNACYIDSWKVQTKAGEP